MGRRSGLAVMAVGALALLAVAPGTAATARGTGTTWAAVDVAVASPVTDLGTPTGQHMETSVAIDPRRPDNVIVGSMRYAAAAEGGGPVSLPSSAIFTSHDGGRTWHDRGNVSTIGGDGRPCASAQSADPSVTFDGRGRAYYAYMASGCGGGFGIRTSTDGGRTWSRPRSLARTVEGQCNAIDKELLSADLRTGTVYMAWTDPRHDCDVESTARPIYLSSAVNGGEWATPRLVSASRDEVAIGATPRVGPDGTLYVAYVRSAPYSGTCPSYESTVVADDLRSIELVVARSRDGGRTWAHARVSPVCDNELLNPQFPFVAAISHPTFDVDPDTGALAVAWSDRSTPAPAIKLATSRDGGRTWSSPVEPGAAPATGAILPSLRADAGGLRLTYLQSNSAGLYDVVFRESHDAGRTWAQARALNTVSSCACYTRARDTGAGAFLGHYMEMDTAAGRIVQVWPDNRSPVEGQTLYARVGSYPPGRTG